MSSFAQTLGRVSLRLRQYGGYKDAQIAEEVDALVKREPVSFPECVLGLIDGKITLAFETPDDAQTAFDIIERTISDPQPLSELEAENARLKARLAEALKALEPFAEAAAYHAAFDDERPIRADGDVLVKHLRAARRVYEGGKVDG